MSNVTQRLQQLRRQQKASQDSVTAEDVKKMTLEELAKEEITFGKTHVGTPFPEMFLNHGYTDWFVGTYHDSPKPAHMKYVRYVELRLDQELQTGQPSTSETVPKGKEQSCQWSEDRRTDLTKASGLAGTVGSSGASGGHRRGVRDAATGANAPVGRTSSLHAGGEQESQPTCEQDGRQCRGDSAASSSDVHQEGAMKSGFSETDDTSSSDDILLTHELDWDFEHPSNHPSKTFQSKCVLLIRQMNKELKEISQEIDQGRFQGKVSRADLFEIMCHDQSELVAQCSRLGGVAFRFGLKEGDLSTSNGRKELFRQLCIRQPTHIWYSPKCGPWSMWSNFNMNRSLDSEQKILQEREESPWQISLAVVLFRFQQIREHHFHMEQPQGISNVESTYSRRDPSTNGTMCV